MNSCQHNHHHCVDLLKYQSLDDLGHQAIIKTHSSVSAAKKTKEDARHTSVLFTGSVKLPNLAFCISKTTKPISTKFTYVLPYIYTTSHIKIEGNSLSSSQDICSWKLPDFLHIFLLILRTKLQIYLSCIKMTFPCFNFFQIWNMYKAHWGLRFSRILRKFKKNWVIYVL